MIQVTGDGPNTDSTVNGNTRFPPEILREIFTHLVEVDSIEQITLLEPPLSEVPFVLGRWRSVSRSTKCLWGIPLLDFPFNYNPEFAVNLVPPTVPLEIYFSDSLDADPKLLIPYLHRCQLFTFRGTPLICDDFFMSTPPLGFANLRSLKLAVSSLRQDSSWIPRSEERIAASTTQPLFFAPVLHTVEIDCMFWPTFWQLLSGVLPWTQVKYLKIKSIFNRDIFPVLSQCTGLVALRVELPGRLDLDSEDIDFENMLLRDLEEVELYGPDTFWLIQLAICNGDHLTKLTLGNLFIPAEDLQNLLQRCPRLIKLEAEVPWDFPLSPISFTHLQSIDLRCFPNDFDFPPNVELPTRLTRFSLPALKKLTLRHFGHHAPSGIRDFIRESKCPLMILNIKGKLADGYMGSLREILSEISSTARFVHCSEMVVDSATLYNIGTGALLPNLESLDCETATIEDIFELMNGRRKIYFRTCRKSLSDDQAQQVTQFGLLHNIPTQIHRVLELDMVVILFGE
ncbi:hypothetical protein H0H92_012103 [Tricholoma furcatifolium]|nr:hypothetical protein H0H92_012103 [Tricholoma furcatifolium]